jgi:hypothetical protein
MSAIYGPLASRLLPHSARRCRAAKDFDQAINARNLLGDNRLELGNADPLPG